MDSFAPPLPPSETLTTAKALQEQQRPPDGPPSLSGDRISPSLLIIAAIIVFVFVVSASIHLLLRFLSRQSSSGASSPLVLLRRTSSSSAEATPSSPPARRGGGRDEENGLIDSLPLFTLGSALTALPKSSPDCAVCLSSFHPHDQLRLLPSCRHAFHSTCIDSWLRSRLSCPLCRSPIVKEPPATPPPVPPLQPLPAPALGSNGSGRFRIEIGSVSRRMAQEGVAPELTPHSRSYSLGSFQYVVDEEMEAVVAAVATHKDRDAGAPAPLGEDVAEAAGWGGGSRSWLRDYVDRLASSASSSFSSLRFGGCGSRRFDCSVPGAGGSWDLEAGAPAPAPAPARQQGADEDERVYYSFYRCLIGV